MSIQHLIDFLSICENSGERDELLSDFERVLQLYHFDYYGIIRTPKPDQNPLSLIFASHWPENWPAHYLAKKFILVDPSIRYIAVAQGPFRWREALLAFEGDPQYRRMYRMMHEAAKFGLEDGYLFPVYGRGGVLGSLTVSGRSVLLSPVEICLFDSIAKAMFWKMVTFSGQVMPNIPQVEMRLTRRELEILSYLGDGLTSNEMSKMLDISNHTVDWYVNELQVKLKAKNRQHMVALAFRLGLII